MRSLMVVICLSSALFAASYGYADSPGDIPLSSVSGNSIAQLPKLPQMNLRNMGLLDPSRFTMKQSTIFSYSSSGMYGANSMAMYLNTMEYKFNMPLTMRLRVAYQNDMGGLFGNKSSIGGRPGIETGKLFVPSFDIIYQPWKNTIISFHYRDFSSMYSNYHGYYGYYRNYDYPFMRY